MTDTLTRVIDVLADIIEDSAQAITAASDLRRDLMLDSLDMYEVGMDLEEEFWIDLDDSAVAACVTVADLVRLVEVANG